MKKLSLMLLVVVLGGCDTMPSHQDFAKDKYNCEEATRGLSPYANTTAGAAENTWAVCMQERGWRTSPSVDK
jgi:uncharacterized protein YceK